MNKRRRKWQALILYKNNIQPTIVYALMVLQAPWALILYKNNIQPLHLKSECIAINSPALILYKNNIQLESQRDSNL